MKKFAFLMLLVIIAASFSASCSKKDEKPIRILSINDIQSDPLAFTGEITINGVVAAFSPYDQTVFGIKDTAELFACRNLECGAFMLPVKYTGNGSMPELADEVNVTGSWKQVDDGFIFEVTKIDVKRNVMKILMS